MRLHGVVRTAVLQDAASGGERVELILGLQGVGPDQPRRVIVPFELLLADPTIDPDNVPGRGFVADVSQDETGRWVVSAIEFAARVLRSPD